MKRKILKYEETPESYNEIFDCLYPIDPNSDSSIYTNRNVKGFMSKLLKLSLELKRNRRLQFKRKLISNNHNHKIKKQPLPRMKSLEKSRLIPNSDKVSPDKKEQKHRVLERKELNSSKNNKSSKITSELKILDCLS